MLPTRTPDEVYRAIILQRLPSFVTEDQIGAVPYMLAAAPVRSGGRNGVLTVPLAFRQHEVEREIDDLDRGVHLAALFFILLGAAIGLSMAERIADPIRQLTRATGRIARGDFDARIAVRSSDELRRLVDAFNSMAAELKAQRDQLERTHRLEAWAEMARQVAHEIKNPLTPIQLSAEHLRRVHADRGEPMGAVLEGCVTSILGQVRLLRQIASEFSSFASSPTARRVAADAAQLVREVVEPYRVGLEGRIEIVNDVAGPCPGCSSIARSSRARSPTSSRTRCTRCPVAGTLRVTSQGRGRLGRDSRRGQRRRHGCRSAGARIRTLLLDQDDRHRPRSADRAAQHRIERRHRFGRERKGARHGGHHEAADGFRAIGHRRRTSPQPRCTT